MENNSVFKLSDQERKELQGVLGELMDGSLDKAVKRARSEIEEAVEKKISDLRETLMAVYRKGGDEDQAEFHAKFVASVVKAKHGDTKAKDWIYEAQSKAALQEGTDSEGGYFVPTDFEARLLREAYETSVIASQCQQIPMAGSTLEIPKMGAGVSVNWTAEEAAATESEPTVGIVQLVAQRLDAFSIASNELLADARINVVDWLTREFAEAIALELDNQIFNGTGSPCSGILTAAAGYSVVMATGLTNFSSVTGDHLSEMAAQIKSSTANGARYWLHRTVHHYLRTLKDDQGQYLYQQIGGPVGDVIWGWPFSLSDKMPASSDSAAGSAFIVFGNPRHFLLGRRQGITMDLSPHVYFTKFQTAFRVGSRWAPKIGLPNAFCRLVTAAS